MAESTESTQVTGATPNELTEQVVAIWRTVLDHPDLTADSHLLDLGATSLNVVRIRAKIRAQLGREVDLLDFLDHPTPRGLAAVVATAPTWQGPQTWHQLDWSTDSQSPA
jgi:acyl carrier protein